MLVNNYCKCCQHCWSTFMTITKLLQVLLSTLSTMLKKKSRRSLSTVITVWLPDSRYSNFRYHFKPGIRTSGTTPNPVFELQVPLPPRYSDILRYSWILTPRYNYQSRTQSREPGWAGEGQRGRRFESRLLLATARPRRDKFRRGRNFTVTGLRSIYMAWLILRDIIKRDFTILLVTPISPHSQRKRAAQYVAG